MWVGGHLKRALILSRPQSFLVASVEQVANVGGSVTLQLAGRKLANLDGWFGKSDPFYLVHKGREDGSWVTVAKSEARLEGARLSLLSRLSPSLRSLLRRETRCGRVVNDAGDRQQPQPELEASEDFLRAPLQRGLQPPAQNRGA